MKGTDYQYDQICELRRACGGDSKLTKGDIKFGSSLCDQYFSKLWLSDSQWRWVGVLLTRAGVLSASDKATSCIEPIEEVFNGKAISDLLLKASGKLKYPKLRYQADGGSKVVFNYATDPGSKWFQCVFIDNGGKENKKRYGFIGSNGEGKLNRDAPSEIKKIIREVAKNPIEVAKLQGQKYSFCCFCRLELTNKSSLHHGYGPICAEKFGLPWGETDDAKDEEEAARKELAHVQLHDLE